jgi:predicted  nucleic acid-binding Zn-ribbon protein
VQSSQQDFEDILSESKKLKEDCKKALEASEREYKKLQEEADKKELKLEKESKKREEEIEALFAKIEQKESYGHAFTRLQARLTIKHTHWQIGGVVKNLS